MIVTRINSCMMTMTRPIHRFTICFATLLILFAVISPAHAGGGPENVAVVINKNSWASKAIANEFIALRQVPANNIVYLDNIPQLDVISVDYFRDRILLPTLTILEERGLATQIDYIVYSADFPYGINIKSDVGDRDLPQVITTTASINGLTFLYGAVVQKDISYLNLSVNKYYRSTTQDQNIPTLTADEQKKYVAAIQSMQQGNARDAESVLRKMIETYPKFAQAHYNLACCLAVQNKSDQAMQSLIRAYELGFSDAKHMRDDVDLKTLRARDDYRSLLMKMGRKDVKVTTQPTQGFRSVYSWGMDGNQVEPGKGLRYMLSTMLAYTSGRGNSVCEAIESLQRSAAADTTFPDGTIYYMKNTNVRSTTRQWAFDSAVDELKELGINAVVEDGHSVPKNVSDIAGLMAGTANLKWEQSGSSILPGAICEHLTSTGGTLSERGSQTPLTTFIRAGAAGASGTVVEPYAVQPKFPTPFIHVHYARGASLAEAFYQSVQGPYQLLVVGDPLCMPWAKRPVVAINGLESGDEVSGAVAFTPRLEPIGPLNVQGYELFLDGRRVGSAEAGLEMRFDSRDLADGWHDMRIVAVTDDLVETQSRVFLPFIVNNLGRSTTLELDAKTTSLDASVNVAVKSPGASYIDITHNDRIVATIEGESGSAKVDPAMLGPGQLTLYAEAYFDTPEHLIDKPVVSKPHQLQINYAPALPPIDPPRGQLKGGLKVTSNGKNYHINLPVKSRDVISKLGIPADRPYSVEAYFIVDEDDLYQLQLQTPGRIAAVEIDFGKSQKIGSSAVWQFMPLHLKRGVHHIKINVTGPGPASFNLRFGNRGTQHFGGDRFQYLSD